MIKLIVELDPLKIGNFHLSFIADESNKGQYLVMAAELLRRVKI